MSAALARGNFQSPVKRASPLEFYPVQTLCVCVCERESVCMYVCMCVCVCVCVSEWKDGERVQSCSSSPTHYLLHNVRTLLYDRLCRWEDVPTIDRQTTTSRRKDVQFTRHCDNRNHYWSPRLVSYAFSVASAAPTRYNNKAQNLA